MNPKRILTAFLAMVMVVVTVPICSIAVTACDPVVSFSLETEPIYEGDTTLTANLMVTLPEDATGYELGCFGLDMSYDSDTMELANKLEWKVKGTKSESESLSDIPYFILWVSFKERDQFAAGTTLAATMTFTLKAPAAVGDRYTIDLDVNKETGVSSMPSDNGQYKEIMYSTDQISVTGITAETYVEEFTEGRYTYYVSGGNATITNYSDYDVSENEPSFPIRDVIIPETLGGYSVIAIGNQAFTNCFDVQHVTIPNSVTTIMEEAFYYCDSLTTVTVGEGVKTIGDEAFSSCRSLESVILGNSINSIGNGAFRECDSLTDINIPNSVTSIGSSAFSSCHALESITLPESVTKIENGTFAGCSVLKDFTIPNSVTHIGKNAFLSCAFESIVIPDSVICIENGAFRECCSLENITIGNNVETLGDSVFYDCSNLKSIIIPDSVLVVSANAFVRCHNIDEVYYGGSSDDWNSISIGKGNNSIKSADFIHYETTDPANHFVYMVDKATCTEDGKAAYFCHCGYSKDEEILAATGHHNIELINVVDMTCTVDGYTGDTYCADCETILEYGEMIPSMHSIVEHSSKIPTCTEIGWFAYETCENCDYTTYVELPEYGHHVVAHKGKTPSCVDSGYSAYETCTKCDYTTYNDLSATGEHIGGTATCVSKAICDVCHNEYGEADENNHGESEIRNAVEATKESDGYTGDTHCKDCGVKLAEGEVIPRLYIPGDATGDDKINLSDVSLTLQYIAKWEVTPDVDAADVTGDGKINLSDVSLLLQYIAKWDVVLK